MTAAKCGKKQPLLMYRRTVDRLFIVTLVFGCLLLMIWMYPVLGGVDYISEGVQTIIFLSAVVVLTLSVFAFIARFRAYIQVHQSYLSLVTPFLHLKISFKRVLSVHPVLVQQILPTSKMSWSQRSYLGPFFGKTALVVELRNYPLNPKFLRLFLGPQLFTSQTMGFVLLVPDWMKFSTELDTFHGRWLSKQNDYARLQAGVE
jgi:hypothetical protein